MLRTIADDVRRPPSAVLGDPIALRRWLDDMARRLDGLAALKAGAMAAAPSVARRGRVSPRATMSEAERAAGLVVERRGRVRPT